MISRFKKGQPLTATDLNALADAACMNIIGGAGCAVTRLGKKLVVNKRLGQKVQKPQQTRGHIYKLNRNLNFKWAWAGASGVKACFDVAANGSRVYGLTKNSIEEPNIVYTLAGLSASGNSLWSTARASDDLRSWGQILDVPEIGVMIPQHSLNTPDDYKFDFQLRDESGTQVWNLNVGGFLDSDIWYNFRRTDGCAFDGENYFTIANMPNTTPAPWDVKLIEFDVDGAVQSEVDLSSGLPDKGSWFCERLTYYNGYFYFAGRKGWWEDGDFTHFVKFNSSGTVSWSFNAGNFGTPLLFHVSRWGTAVGNVGQDICVTTDEYVYCVGLRSNTWTGATGNASLWKFNSAGTLQWSWDSGGDLMACAADDDGNVYVGGVRTDSWPGGAIYRNVWKLDGDGNVIATFDTGSYSDTEEESIVRALRIYLSGVFIGCTWDGVAE